MHPTSGTADPGVSLRSRTLALPLGRLGGGVRGQPQPQIQSREGPDGSRRQDCFRGCPWPDPSQGADAGVRGRDACTRSREDVRAGAAAAASQARGERGGRRGAGTKGAREAGSRPPPPGRRFRGGGIGRERQSGREDEGGSRLTGTGLATCSPESYGANGYNGFY